MGAEHRRRELASRARACVVTTAEPIRSLPPDELLEFARAAGIEQSETAPDPATALLRAEELARPEDLVVLTGSVYFAGALRPLLLGRQQGR